MFGFKIVKEAEYKKLLRRIENLEGYLNDAESNNKKLEKDIRHLREQVNKNIKERQVCRMALNESEARLDQSKKDFALELVKAKNDAERNAMSALKDMVIIHNCDYPCEKCQLKGGKCKKLTFHNQTICVSPKEDVNSFCGNTAKSRRNKK